MKAHKGSAVVFDIGGTSLRVGLALHDGVGETVKVPTPQSPDEGVRVLAELILSVAGKDVRGIAGGFPGVLENGVVRFAPNLPEWVDVKLAALLEEKLGAPAEVENDADLAALGEAVYGAGKGARVVAYLGIGTGVGTGRVVDSAIESGVFDLEAGHQILDAREGATLEGLVSGSAILRRFGVRPEHAPRELFDELTPVLAAGLHNAIVHWSPEVLVLGGSLMNEETGFRLAEVSAALGRIPSPYPRLPHIALAERGDAAGLYGALALLR